MRRVRARLDRGCYIGTQRTFLTFCTFERHSAFTTPEIVEQTLREFLRACTRDDFEIVAYCFMPDHVHLLVGGTTAESDLVRWIGISKQFSAVAYRRSAHKRLWQEGWFDRVVRNSDDVGAIIRYVLENPIRAAIVDEVGKYPFWGSCTHSREDLLASIARRT